MKKSIVLFLLFLGFSLPAYADEAVLEELNIQNIELSAQNQELKRSIATNQSIYFGALGFSGAFLIAFLGVNIYFSKTRADEDRAKIEAVLDERLKQATLKMKSELIDDLNKLKNENEQLISSHKREIISLTDLKFNEALSTRQYLDYRITVIEFDLLPDNSPNKLSSAIKVIKKSELIGWEWKTASMLSKIEEYINSGMSFHATEISDVMKSLSTIKEPNKSLAQHIEKKILETDK
ncbi:TPA: hypothetical protein ACPJ11_004666 [Vibrio diabolicus]